MGIHSLGLGIGLVVMAPVVIDLESVLYFRDFIRENRVSDSKYRSKIGTRETLQGIYMEFQGIVLKLAIPGVCGFD